MWEKLGTQRMSRQAVLVAMIVMLVPTALSLTLPTPLDSTMVNDLAPSSNVATLAALAYLCVAYGGRLWGTITFGALYWGLAILPAEAPHLAIYSPRTFFIVESGFHDRVPWRWLMILAVAVAWTAWRRRGLPLRLSIRATQGFRGDY